MESGVKDIMRESPVLLDYIWELISEVIAVVNLHHSFTPPQKTNKQKKACWYAGRMCMINQKVGSCHVQLRQKPLAFVQ